MSALTQLFKTPGTEESGPIGVIVAAPPNLAQRFLTLGPGNPTRVEVLSTTRDANDLAEDVAHYKPQVVLLSPEIRNYKPDLVARFARWPEFPIAIVGLVPSAGVWGSEMAQSGALAFYNTPITSAIVEQFAQAAPELVARSRESWRAPVLAGGATRAALDAVQATAYRSGVVAFWSTKGGDGKTTLSTETACLLSQVGGRKTLLVDANMNAGTIGLHLGIQADRSTILHLASDYMGNRNQMTAEMLRRRAVAADSYIDERTRSPESRLDVLVGILNPEQASAAELFGEQGERFMDDLLRLARDFYDFVIVDLGSSTQIGPHFGALRAADTVVVISTCDRTSVFFNKETLDTLVDDGQLRPDKFRLVINRVNPRANIDLKEIAGYLGLTVFAWVPEDVSATVLNNANEGRSFAMAHLGGRKNEPEVEATLRGLLSLAEGLFPPLGQIVATRAGKRKGGFLFGRRGGGG